MNMRTNNNPGIVLNLLKRIEDLEKAEIEKDATIARQKNEIHALLEGISIKGWWCMHVLRSGKTCDTFNGEDKEKRDECRYCGVQKPVLHG